MFWSLFISILCADYLERLRRYRPDPKEVWVAVLVRIAVMALLAGAVTAFIKTIR